MRPLTIAVGMIFFAASLASAGTYTQGYEGTGYDFFADPGSFAGISNTVAHSGSQSAQFTLDATHFAYTRWKSEDISASGFTVGNIIASFWVMRDYGRADLSPYVLFTIVTPDTGQETLAIQFSMPSVVEDVWSLNSIGRGTTTFHVVGDRTGLGATEFSASGTQGTLEALAGTTYSGGTRWGDFPVSHVRVGVGLWDASQTWNGFADDLTIDAVPEPGTLMLLGAAVGLLALRRRP